MELRGKRALVMGLGIHGGGLGVARFLANQGARVTVTDLRGPELLQPSLDALADLPIRYVLGKHDEQDFRDADLVVRNPGVPRESRFLQLAREAGAAIEMEMTLFFRLCPGPILGITGTKGKTTTTLLLAAMVREQHPDTVVAGNLRVSALETLPRITAGTPVVLELSSWQLEGLGEAQQSPGYACVTNLSADHLDRYGSMAAYAEAKHQIVRWQKPTDVAVLNRDDPVIAGWAATAPGMIAWFGKRRETLAAGMGMAALFDDEGVWLHEPEHDASGDAQMYLQRLASRDEIRLAGRHNRANVAAAAALARAFGVETALIRQAIRQFRGVEHRLELVRTLDGVRYINDTTATAPEAAIAALYSFESPIILLAGGADKQLPFDALARAIHERAKAVVLLDGTATRKLMEALAPLDDRQQTIEDGAQSSIVDRQSPILGPYDDFARAIGAARELADPGDVVLLSPGCASFGMFRNEFHRGEQFREIVGQL